MRIITSVCVLVLALSMPALPVAAQDPARDSIAWSEDLPTALEAAKKAEKLLMVCINAKSVHGEIEEPAAKGLREVVYRDPRVVERSRDFVCVFLTAEGSSKEYDALRELGIDGEITSPQHIFISSDGTRIVHRRAYWVFGKGERAVEALLDMMTKAEKLALVDPGAADGGDGPPPSDAERAAWIAGLLEQVANPDKRYAALRELMSADKDGDCSDPVIALIPEYAKDEGALRAIVRALGRDGLEAAALPVAELLKHKEDTIRANAAVSLEYIGSQDKKVIAALRKLADKEKDDAIANHAYRALGRCGAKDAKTRDLLLKKATNGKSEFATYGPCMGLAYFEDDEKAMRGVEKMLKLIGIPGGGRGGGQNAVKRGLVSWTLANIGDVKSGKFVREELIAALENVRAFWVEGLRGFWDLVARVCEGEKEALPQVEIGVGVFVRFSRGADLGRYGAEDRHLMDEARKNRSDSGFRPKGDNLLNVDDE